MATRHPASSKRIRITDGSLQASRTLIRDRQFNRMQAEGKYESRFLEPLDQAALPESLVQLLSDMERLQDGYGTLPSSLSQELQDTGEIDMSRTECFYEDQNHMHASWEIFRSIVTQARACFNRGDHEAGWNSAVHHNLLNLACRLSGHREHVSAVNISYVRPRRELLPYGKEIRMNMVDFGLVINPDAPDDKLARFYQSHSFPEQDFKTWNHTTDDLTARNPLVVSIETSRQDVEAQLRLGAWGFAHLQRLLELRKSTSSQNADSISLPQIVIQGAEFKLMIIRGDYNVTKDSLKVIHYTAMTMGDVLTYKGFFRVLACLQNVVEWIHESYRPWLEDWTGAA